MSQQEHGLLAEQAPPAIDLEHVASYKDGDATVICDRQEPTAWIRSTVTVPMRR